MADRTTAYAADVAEGRIGAGRLIRLACERHLRDLAQAKARGWTFDVEAAERVLDFFPACLRHSKGEWAGKPVDLAPWQCFVVGSLFGWRSIDTGLRRFAAGYVSIGRKNGKSTLAAGLGLWLTGPEGEPGAQCFVVATKEEQARMVFNEAAAMLRRSTVLQRNGFRGFVKSITFRDESFMQPLGRDSKTHDGFNPSALIADEVHAMRDRSAIEVIESGMGARRQPLSVYITTRGEDFPGICKELDDLSIKVLEGIVEADNHFAFVAAMDEGDAWDDAAAWHKANPNLGVSVKMGYLEAQCAKAKLVPARQIEFKRKHANLWTGAVAHWFDVDHWLALPPSVGDDELAGGICFAGLDLSGKLDLTALAMAFPHPDGHTDLRAHFWLPEGGIYEREQRDGIPWRTWADAGWLTLCPGSAIDYDVVADEATGILAQYDTRKVAFDRWKMDQFKQALARIGAELEMEDFGQGFRDMGPASEEFEALFMAGKLRHNGNPILTMCIANAVAVADPAGNKKPAKDKAAGRIDGAVAAIMAVGVMARDPSLYGKPQAVGAIWL